MLVVSRKTQQRVLSCRVTTYKFTRQVWWQQFGLGWETQHCVLEQEGEEQEEKGEGVGGGRGLEVQTETRRFLRSMGSLCKVRLLGFAALFLGSARPPRPRGGRSLSPLPSLQPTAVRTNTPPNVFC